MRVDGERSTDERHGGATKSQREELRELGFPVFSVGANPNGPTKNVPGRINWPVSVGGIAVRPGDLVVGDARAWEPGVSISNSFGFGGHNGTVVLRAV